MCKKALIIFIALFASTVFAGNAENVTITKLGTGPLYESLCGGPCIPIKVTPQHSGHANCAQNVASWDFVLATSTEAGKQAYAQLLAAHMSGKSVSIFGKGSCLSDYEEINFLITK